MSDAEALACYRELEAACNVTTMDRHCLELTGAADDRGLKEFISSGRLTQEQLNDANQKCKDVLYAFTNYCEAHPRELNYKSMLFQWFTNGGKGQIRRVAAVVYMMCQQHTNLKTPHKDDKILNDP